VTFIRIHTDVASSYLSARFVAFFRRGLQKCGLDSYKAGVKAAALFAASIHYLPEKTVTSPSYPAADATQSTLNNQPINVNEEASLNYWVSALDCSELELRVAVAEVGPSVKDVSNELGRVL
jgi:hypothetical protein